MLAIHGGKKVRTMPFPAQKTTDVDEIVEAIRVLHTKRLSHYRGNNTKYFYGGPKIEELEHTIISKFKTKFAIPCNSCTSALHIACGAIGLQPGDEVIVTPWSMTCSATAPLIYGAIPVFADIEEDYFCLDPKSIKEKITEKTKAIIVVDLFGQPCDVEAIRKIAKEHNLYVIEDAAQAIGSKYNNEYAGTFFDIGCYSFTQGKHLTAGEGGMIVTNNSQLAQNCRLLMNHAESVVNDYTDAELQKYHSSLVGFNMRMTEIQAAIIIEQLKKLDEYIDMRRRNAAKLNFEIPFHTDGMISEVGVRENCTHSYYVQGFKYNQKDTKVSRDFFISTVVDELVGEEGRADRPMLGCGYIKPIYEMPLFEHQTYWAFKQHCGSRPLPYEYNQPSPVVQKMHKQEFFLSMYHNLPLDQHDIWDIGLAFSKVYKELVRDNTNME